MARNLTKISSDLRKAADRVQKLQWRKPVVREQIRTLRDKPAPKGVSIVQMLRAAPPEIIKAARDGDVHVIRQQRRVRAGQLGYWFMTSTREVKARSGAQARQHEQTIKVKDKAPRLQDSKDLMYECTCPYFKFYLDYAFHQKGLSELNHSTNEPPVDKNPDMKIYPCKHIARVCEAILEQHL